MCADYAFSQNAKPMPKPNLDLNIQSKEVLATASLFAFVWIMLCLI